MPKTSLQILATSAANEMSIATSAREADNKRLRDENKELSDLRVQTAVLKERAAFAMVGDSLLTIGSIGFGFLGAHGQNALVKTEQVNSSLANTSIVLLTLAIVGFGLKILQWLLQIFGKY